MNKPHSYLGTLVALEGLPGAGKTTLAAQLAAAHARHLPADTVFTSEPYDRIRVRQRLDSGDDPYAVFTSDRSDHVEAVIKPALKRGALVICDRYTWSTAVLQAASSVEVGAIQIHQGEIFPEPDLWIYLDTHPEECLSRVRSRGDLEWEQYRERLEEFSLWRARYDLCALSCHPSRVQRFTNDGGDPFLVRVDGSPKEYAINRAIASIQEASK